MPDANPVDETAGIGLGQGRAGGLGVFGGTRPDVGDATAGGQPLGGRQPDSQVGVDVAASDCFSGPDRTVGFYGVEATQRSALRSGGVGLVLGTTEPYPEGAQLVARYLVNLRHAQLL